MSKQSKTHARKAFTLLLSILMIGLIAGAFTACGSSSDEENKKKEYVKTSQFKDVLKNPDDYKGKYIKIGGQVFNTETGDTNAFQVYHNPNDYSEDFVVYSDTADKIHSDDFVMIDGKIAGSFKGENALGNEVTCLQVEADSVKKTDYQHAVAPAIKTKKVNKTAEQYGVSITLKKIEFAENETRFYLSTKNNSSSSVSLYTDSDSVAIQGGKQYNVDSDKFVSGYPSVDSLSANAGKEAIVVFPKMDPNKAITYKLEDPYSDNYNIEMHAFTIYVK